MYSRSNRKWNNIYCYSNRRNRQWSSNTKCATGAFTDSAGNTNNTTTKTGLTIDNTAPLSFNITAQLGSVYNSVIVNGETTDEHSGIAGYKYSSDNGTNWTEQTTQGTYTFSNLTVGNTYYFKMKAIDSVGNKTESNTVTITIQNPIKRFTSADVGKYVNYDAGTWTQADINKLGSNYSASLSSGAIYNKFGEFKVGDSRNDPITDGGNFNGTWMASLKGGES